jgi:dipeptidyl aminopeptidase/acylaminoacyl peptidase
MTTTLKTTALAALSLCATLLAFGLVFGLACAPAFAQPAAEVVSVVQLDDVWIRGSNGGPSDGVLSPDGKSIAFRSQSKLLIFDLATRRYREGVSGIAQDLTTSWQVYLPSIAWSADGASLYFTDRIPDKPGVYDLYRASVTGGDKKKIASNVAGGLSNAGIHVSPRGNFVLFSRGAQPKAGRLFVVDKDGKTEWPLLANPPSGEAVNWKELGSQLPTYEAAQWLWSPDGKEVGVVPSWRSKGTPVSASPEIGVRPLSFPGQRGLCFSWSNNGFLAILHKPGGQYWQTLGEIAAVDLASGQTRTLTASSGRYWRLLGVTPDGLTVATRVRYEESFWMGFLAILDSRIVPPPKVDLVWLRIPK